MYNYTYIDIYKYGRKIVLKKTAAFFDIDGTIYRDSLLLDHFKKLIKYEIIPEDSYTKEAKDDFQRWVKRQGGYENYMLKTSDLYRQSLAGIKSKDIEFTVNKLMKLNAEKVYTYTRDRIKWHLDNDHIVIFISGSPSYLVEGMAEIYNATDCKGSEYITDNGVFTGEVKPMWDRISKTNAMNEFISKYNIDLENSYAYGDTNGDFFMLERVGNPIAFNPSKELLLNLKNSNTISDNLKIVVERKDTVYVLDKILNM